MNQAEVKRQRIQMFSGVISMITLLILGRILGNNGLAYIAAGTEVFFLTAAVVYGGISDSLGRILRGRSARGQSGNAAGMRKNAMALQCAAGAAGTVILAVAAKPLSVYVLKLPYSEMILLVLSPAILLRSVSSVLTGYFQGEGSELPAAVTSVLRPLLLLGFACLSGHIFKEYGAKVSSLLGKTEFTSMYAGAGAAAAAWVTELFVILFLFLIYRGSRKKQHKKQEPGGRQREAFASTFRLLYGNRAVSVLIYLLTVLPLLSGMIFFFKSAADADAAAESYGLFFGKYLAGTGLAAFLLCGLLLPICSKTAVCFRKEEYRYAKNSFQSGIHIAWANTLFFSVVSGVLAKQLAAVLNPESSGVLERMLQTGSGLLAALVFSFYFGKILLLLGKKYVVSGCLGVVDILFAIMTAVFLNIGNAGVMALVYAGLVSGFVLAGLLGFFAFRFLRAAIRPVPVIAIPAGAGCLAGLVCALSGKLLTPQLGELAALIAGALLSFLVFWGLLLLLRNFREQELAELYKFHKKG